MLNNIGEGGTEVEDNARNAKITNRSTPSLDALSSAMFESFMQGIDDELDFLIIYRDLASQTGIESIAIV